MPPAIGADPVLLTPRGVAAAQGATRPAQSDPLSGGFTMPARLSLHVPLAVASLFMLTPAIVAETHRPVELPDRLRGADAAVVARVVSMTPRYQRNRWGDELIVSRAVVAVEETLKGRSRRFESVDVEGGTIGDVTLRVSDMPSLRVGERAVFMVTQGEAGAYVPHLRGQGILRLDDANHVRGTSLSLDMIRAAARGLEK